MLGNLGSEPRELFFDVVDELDQTVDEHIRSLESVLSAQDGHGVNERTTWDEFRSFIAGSEQAAAMDDLSQRGAFKIVRHLSLLSLCGHIR